jgi:hypothetical protein
MNKLFKVKPPSQAGIIFNNETVMFKPSVKKEAETTTSNFVISTEPRNTWSLKKKWLSPELKERVVYTHLSKNKKGDVVGSVELMSPELNIKLINRDSELKGHETIN